MWKKKTVFKATQADNGNAKRRLEGRQTVRRLRGNSVERPSGGIIQPGPVVREKEEASKCTRKSGKHYALEELTTPAQEHHSSLTKKS